MHFLHLLIVFTNTLIVFFFYAVLCYLIFIDRLSFVVLETEFKVLYLLGETPSLYTVNPTFINFLSLKLPLLSLLILVLKDC